jgi:hypothetical protein
MTLIAKPAAKVNYLNNRDILKEIHLSKNTYCSFRDRPYKAKHTSGRTYSKRDTGPPATKSTALNLFRRSVLDRRYEAPKTALNLAHEKQNT